MSTDGYRRPRSGPRIAFLLLLVIVLIGAGAYFFYADDTGIRQTLSTVREGSADAATTAKVKGAYALSQRISGFDIDVDTRDGVVTLRGQVPSEDVKELASSIAADTSGVTRVVNELTVDPAALPDPETTQLAQRVADLELRATLQSMIDKDPELAAANVQVSVEGGGVTLAGTAPSAELSYRAEELARGTAGVDSVVSAITVTGSADGAAVENRLPRQVEFELYSSKAFNLERIQVSGQGAEVRLGGTVRSEAERLLAERIAADVAGVQNVVNQLQVAPGGVAPGERAL